MRFVFVVCVVTLACSNRDAPDVAAAAGKVVELTGSVSASRAASAPRALTVGDQVFADDVVDTGGDGSVTIELFHNHARWAMEPQQKKRVDESAAWQLAKQDAPTGPADHPTSAAGRNAERAAAETRATSGVASAGSANGAAQPLEPQAAVPVDKPPPVKPEAPKGAKDGKVSAAPAGSGGGTAEIPRDRGLQQDSSPDPQKPRTLDALTGQQAALAACIAAGAKVTITVHVVKGKATAVDKDAKRKACLDAVLAKIQLPVVDEDVSLQLAR